MRFSILKVTAAALVALLFGMTSLTVAQQASPQPTNRATVQSRGTQPTRTYRSYSVSPSTTRQSGVSSIFHSPKWSQRRWN